AHRAIRADRAGQLAREAPRDGPQELDPVAKTRDVLRHRETERDRLRVTSVRAPDLRRVGLGLGDRDAARDERTERWHDDALDTLAVPQRVRRVDDVV